MGLLRNGSAYDSRSKGCKFKSRPAQLFFEGDKKQQKRKIALGRDTVMKFEKIVKDKGNSFKRIVVGLIFPVVTYWYNSWVLRK
ncbi:hypothetical protein LAZ67_6000544 [Cordylochernes scorpioides]|uniref:Uncharacterized protein n=1 Tax=Cordylochernes scorpioides TaxID=51811 RepID=A0ABY6KIR2_9ARAC|nr:hypothetical protein LAZ67_6000544 [Cordylochernes scorpioides]